MLVAADNELLRLKLEVKSARHGNPQALQQTASTQRKNPIAETFRDVSPFRLVQSTWRVFWRIRNLQGWQKAFRVFPIVWMIITAVRGFARYHSEEYDRVVGEKNAGADVEEAVLTSTQNEEYRKLGRWLCQELHDLGPNLY